MIRFDNTGLWEVVKHYDNSPATLTSGLDTVLDDFIVELYTYCREEKSMAERTRTLNYARSELAAYAESGAYELKKHSPLRTVIKRAIYAIDSELDLLKMELAYPERFITFPADNAPLARWNGKVADLIEYSIGPQVSGKLLKPSGEPMSYADVVEFIENVFGVTIPGAYDRKTKILSRQKNTTFQDEMRQVFLEEAKKMDK